MTPPTSLGLPADLALLFAPLHKRAFGMATGLAAALVVFLVTAVHLLRSPRPDFDIELLGQYFAGYSASWAGAAVGAAWAFVAGFVAGWFFAFSRNTLIAAWLFLTRTRAELAATRDFLDHV